MPLQNDQLIIVTGGAGFIGSHVVAALNQEGFSRIVIFDELGIGEKWKNLVGKKFLDIFPKHTCFEWLKSRESEIGAIIHLGACSSTVEKNANYLLENNYRYSVKLAEYALKSDIRFIYASSAATYGNGELGFSDDENILEELRPLNMYGFSKHLFDLWLKKQGALTRVAGLKYFNVFGPGEGHKGRMASAIYHMFPAALKEKTVRLFQSSEPHKYKDGEQMRDFIYVKDAAKMTTAFLKSAQGGIFNIGSGKPETWNHLASCLFDALNMPLNIHYIPMPEDLQGKYQNYSAAPMEKTYLALNKTLPATPFKTAVKDYVHNHLLQDSPW